MSGITFTIQNPNSKPVNQACVYLGIDNELDFIFSNDLGIPTVNPGDLFTIIVPGSLLQTVNTNQLEGTAWILQSITQPPADPNFTFTLTPKQAISFTNPITISFIKLTGNEAGHGDVSASYTISNQRIPGTSEKLFVMDPPDENKLDLLDVISFAIYVNDAQQEVGLNQVFISPSSLQPPIANQLHLNLTYSGTQLAEQWTSKYTPSFIISFSYGNQPQDLTDALQEGGDYNPLTSAWKITSSLAGTENVQWNNLGITDGTAPTPVWEVSPQVNNQSLFTHNNKLDILFDHVISILPAGPATIFIQWINIPGYNPGVYALNIEKVIPQATVISFTTLSGELMEVLNSGEPVQLKWETFGAAQVEIDWMDDSQKQAIYPAYSGPPQLTYSATTPAAGISLTNNDVQFYLTALDDKGNKISSQSEPVHVLVKPIISSFTATIQRDEQGSFIAFEWTTADANSCTIPGIEKVLPKNTNGTPVPLRINSNNYCAYQYTLTATGANNMHDQRTVQASVYIEKTVQLSGTPSDITIGPDGKMVVARTITAMSHFDAINIPDQASDYANNSPFGLGANQLAIAPGNRLWVSQQSSSSLYYVDLNTMQSNSWDVVNTVYQFCSTPGGQVYIIFEDVHNIGLILNQTPPGLANMTQVMPEPAAMAVTPDGSTVFVSCMGPQLLCWYNADGSGSVQNTQLGECISLVTTPDNKFVILAMLSPVLDSPPQLFSLAVRNPTVYPQPLGALNSRTVAIMPCGIVLSTAWGNLVYWFWFDYTDNPVGSSSALTLTNQPAKIVVSPDGTRAFVMGSDANITVLGIKYVPQPNP